MLFVCKELHYQSHQIWKILILDFLFRFCAKTQEVANDKWSHTTEIKPRMEGYMQ